MNAGSATDLFVHDDPACPACRGEGVVCEDHTDTPWGGGDGCCGAPGAPCPHREDDQPRHTPGLT